MVLTSLFTAAAVSVGRPSFWRVCKLKTITSCPCRQDTFNNSIGVLPSDGTAQWADTGTLPEQMVSLRTETSFGGRGIGLRRTTSPTNNERERLWGH